MLLAALRLLGHGRSFGGLSLREVTREAGLAPNAFYRHFRNLDALGLALVEETGVLLRAALKAAREIPAPPDQLIRHSVQLYADAIRAHPLAVRFVAGARCSGSRVLRDRVRLETRRIACELADHLESSATLPTVPREDLDAVCDLAVLTLLNAAVDLLDLPDDAPDAAQSWNETFVQYLRTMFLGVVRRHGIR